MGAAPQPNSAIRPPRGAPRVYGGARKGARARQIIELEGLDGPAPERPGPVLLELTQPAEAEVGVDEPPVEPRLHLRPERGEPREARERPERAQPIAAPRCRVGLREAGVLLFEECSDVGPEVVVEIHGSSRSTAACSRHLIPSIFLLSITL